MRYAEIALSKSHPHSAVLRIDPVQFSDLKRLIQDSDEVRILHCANSEADVWTIHLGCASKTVAERMQDGWN